MKAKGIIRLAAAALIIAAAVFIAVYGIGLGHFSGSSAADTEASSGSANNKTGIKLGLDLAGGVSITYEAVKEDPTDVEMSDTVYKMQKRAESFSTEAQVYPEGNNRVTVSIPDVTDADAVLSELGDAGNIYFIYGMSSRGVRNIEYVGIDPETLDRKYVLTRSLEEIAADGDVVIDGSDIADAQPNMYQDEINRTQYIVELSLNESGTQKFADATRYCYQYYYGTTDDSVYQRIIAIVYDGEVVSAPGVATVITEGKATISGQKDFDESKKLATTIRVGALPLELSVLRYYVVGAQLGADALDTSLLAGLIGFVLIMIFMIAMYRIPGVAASLALAFYVALVVICLDIFSVTLTLPGIAGIILSVGMAVDANVIIFTRIKEEIGSGKTVRSAIKLGFDKALSAIVDGNVTTIIAAIVLYFLGSGTVKGFAQTLAIGVVLSMITALFVTKFILNSLFMLGADKVSMYGTKNPRKPIAFTSFFKRAILIPAAIAVFGIVMLFVNKGKYGTPFNYSLDFAGGTATSVVFEGGIPDGIQAKLDKLVYDTVGMSPEVSLVESESMVTIRTKELSTDDRAAVASMLTREFGVEEELITTNSVGSAVSSEMKRDAVVAVIVATICMLIYIWFRFSNLSFALSAVLALLHDVIMVLVLYAACSSFITVGNTFIACMLTIVGYSINATIVIFDRIREIRKEQFARMTTEEIVNTSITDTLSRSINTSLTTFFTVFILAILGVSSVKEFAIPLICGIVCGAFSSVCVTGPLWFNLQKKLTRKDENA